MNTDGRIFLALDGLTREASTQLLVTLLKSEFGGSIAGVKIHDLWDREGSDVVNSLSVAGAPKVWTDLKLHDVPKTVALRARAVRASGAKIITVHTTGGIEMMRAAMDAADDEMEVFGITILTSLDPDDVHEYFGNPPKTMVLKLARYAKLAGLGSIVCSVHELSILRSRSELRNMRLITPGIRLKGKGATDANQKRVDSPQAAFEAGAYQIVVGSEITGAENPVAVLGDIVTQIAAVGEAKKEEGT